MRIVVLGGAGIIGRVIARDLVEQSDVTEVVVADLDQAGSQAVVEALDSPKARATPVDVTEHQGLVAVLGGADACVNAVQYYFNLEVMRGCLAARVPYVDLGGLFHMTRRQLALDNEFRQAGLTAILGLGSCPGVSNVQAAYAAGRLDTVEAIHIFNASTVDEDGSLSWAYSIDTILDEITQLPMVYRDRAFQAVEPLSEEQHYLFRAPIGYVKVHQSLHSEVATLPLTYAEKGVREVWFKIHFFGYSEAALRRLQFLAELGFADTEPIGVKGTSVRPRDVLKVLLRRAPAAQKTGQNPGFKDIATEVTGTRDGRLVRYRIDTTAWPYPAWDVSGGTLLVAAPPAIAAVGLASREIRRPGVHPPEVAVPPEPFFDALAERGATTEVTETVLMVNGEL